MAPSGAHGRQAAPASPYNHHMDDYQDYDDGAASGPPGMMRNNSKVGPGGGGQRNYDPRQIQGGYDVRSRAPPQGGSGSMYYSDDQSYGGGGTASDYGYSDDQYYSDTPAGGPPGHMLGQHPSYAIQAPIRGGMGGPPRPHPQQDGWYRPGGSSGPGDSYGYMDEYGMTSFSDEEADELDSRLSRFSGMRGLPGEGRSKSMMRYNELERERTRRRQDIVKYKTKSKLFPGTIKLSMMNTGLIPIKKGRIIYQDSTFPIRHSCSPSPSPPLHTILSRLPLPAEMVPHCHINHHDAIKEIGWSESDDSHFNGAEGSSPLTVMGVLSAKFPRSFIRAA